MTGPAWTWHEKPLCKVEIGVGAVLYCKKISRFSFSAEQQDHPSRTDAVSFIATEFLLHEKFRALKSHATDLLKGQGHEI